MSSDDPSARLSAAVAQLEPDSVRVLALIAERLVMGRKQYGDLDIAHDKRDFGAELLAELLDGCVYLACDDIRAGKRRPAPLPSLRANTWTILSRAVESGVAYGWRRAHKHTDEPEEAAVRDEIERAVMNECAEVFRFED